MTNWTLRISVAASVALFAVVVGQDWYRLGPYEPSGWDASDYLKLAAMCGAVVAALGLAVFLGLLDRGHILRAVRTLTTVAFLAVAFRVAFPPDFGIDAAESERLAGAWLGFGVAAVAAIGAWLSR